MKLCEILTVVAIAILMSGCAAVYVPEPLGEEAVKLDDSWSGTWLHDDGIITTRVADADKGTLDVVWIEESEGKFKMETFTAIIRSHDGHVFANFKDKDSDHGYFWLLVDKRSRDEAVIWSANAKQFRSLISDSKLEGQILHPESEHNHNVALKEVPGDLLEKITEPSANLLQWQEPGFMVRVTD